MYAVTFHHWQYCDIKRLNYKQKYCVQNVSLFKYYEQNVVSNKRKVLISQAEWLCQRWTFISYNTGSL